MRIGTLALVAGGSIVTQDLARYRLVQGDRARLVLLNLVGPKVAGFSVSEIAALKRVRRGLFRGQGPLTERIAAVEAGDGDGRVRGSAAFLHGSAEGIATSRQGPAAAA